ncbi:MAG: 4Fe-4S binding protein [Lachnospiraceae bacterium]|nr:4Fe-4S binding protein [Lachnospiraceae bacterium]MBR3242206.1 4Fe-4S binding protein [Parasporobacterium sp.]MBR3360166.1 4Fe-4S binding protein [Lachnospiraceae bacterium]MBR7076879.1 4Fe-4S binding protein [Lachnospiraceae bacterium]
MYYPRCKDIAIDTDKCVGCGKCVLLCFVDTLRMNEETKKPYVAYLKDCEGCLVCESNCPVGAIHVTPIYPIHVADPFR